mgnify:FL=1
MSWLEISSKDLVVLLIDIITNGLHKQQNNKSVWKTVPSHPIKHQWIKIKLKMDKDIFVVFIY